MASKPDDRVIASSRSMRRLAKDEAEGYRQAELAAMKGDIRPDQKHAYAKGWINRGFYR